MNEERQKAHLTGILTLSRPKLERGQNRSIPALFRQCLDVE